MQQIQVFVTPNKPYTSNTLAVHAMHYNRFDDIIKYFRQWLFCRRRQFVLGIYFAVIIHM